MLKNTKRKGSRADGYRSDIYETETLIEFTILEFTIRWRLNDPAAEWRARWTKNHIVRASHRHDSEVKALCGVAVPDFPYDWTYDDAAGTPMCKRCFALKAEGNRDEVKASETT